MAAREDHDAFTSARHLQRFVSNHVKIANRSIYGLAASVWTRDFKVAHRMAARLRAGTIGINRHFVGDSSLPFGGFRQSGWGRERGKEVFDAYLETKTIASPL